MRIPRLYNPGPLGPSTETVLDAVAAKHATSVLRLRIGDRVVLFDGNGREASATIKSVRRKLVVVDVQDVSEVNRESPLSITLVQGISRGERMDFTIQKATELGVSAIVPIVMKRTVVKLNDERAAKRLMHWRRIAISACEQCGRNMLPDVAMPNAFAAWLEASDTDALSLLFDPQGDVTLGTVERPADGRLTLVIGPEGGLDDRERDALYRRGFTGASLGPRVLRTETAALTAISVLQQRFGDV